METDSECFVVTAIVWSCVFGEGVCLQVAWPYKMVHGVVWCEGDANHYNGIVEFDEGAVAQAHAPAIGRACPPTFPHRIPYTKLPAV